MATVRFSVALVLVVVTGCGRLGFDPTVDAAPDAALRPTVQTGRARLPQGSRTTEVSIAAVAPERSLLTFSLAVTDEKPDDVKVTGIFLGNSRIEFERSGTEFAVEIRWSVTSWDRMTVRRGEQSFAGVRQLTALVEPPVDMARSFAIATHRDAGSLFQDDEYIEVQLLGGTQLFAQSRVVNSNTTRLVWQVVELDAGVVHHGTARLDPVTTLTEVITPSFDPARTWLVYTHSAEGTASLEAQHQAIGGRIVDGTRIAFERGGGSGTAHISWSLVELAAGMVEHGESTFPDAASMIAAPITPVDPTRSFVFGGSFGGTSGRTTSIDPGPGPAWVAAELTANDLILQRGISTGTTISPWSVITLE